MPRNWVDFMPGPTPNVFTNTQPGDMETMFYLLLKHSTWRVSSYSVKAVKVEVPSG